MKFIGIGTYSASALGGFITKPEDDRKSVVSSLVNEAGGTVNEFYFLRGSQDFAVILELPDFDAAAAIKLLVISSGAVDQLELLEVIDMNKIAAIANATSSAYRTPGS